MVAGSGTDAADAAPGAPGGDAAPTTPDVEMAAGGAGAEAPEARCLRQRKGEVFPRGVGALRYFCPPSASVQWQPDGLTIHTLNKVVPGAGFLGAPPISLTTPDLTAERCEVGESEWDQALVKTR